jgi:hypothetical protein
MCKKPDSCGIGHTVIFDVNHMHGNQSGGCPGCLAWRRYARLFASTLGRNGVSRPYSSVARRRTNRPGGITKEI